MYITTNMTNSKDDNKKSNLLDAYQSTKLLDNLQKPNTQFIRQATQLNKRATELVNYFEKVREKLNIKIESVSHRTGSGFLINTADYEITDKKMDNIVEVIDYDPIRNNMMVIGNLPPINEAIIHWFIYRGFNEINNVIIINNLEIFELFKSGSYPELVYKDGVINTNFALNILKVVKNSKIVLLNGSIILGVLITGKSLDEVYDILNLNLKKQSKLDDLPETSKNQGKKGENIVSEKYPK